uniref:Uncharacterized protein n=1 Tax=Candidatus Kentrum sp. TC TaxID=2126339 RepID=A0A450YSS3_9GAMM|nr:MAG: hypothetical protein BECKTC1821E_GA0114239_103714 [Candidatus Kentron sp. TC]
MLYSFSDAASLEHRSHQSDSVYYEAQKRIFDSLRAIYEKLGKGSKNVIFIAQSLGGQVLSNYIWDAQSKNPKQGVWMEDYSATVPKGSDIENFIRLKGLKTLFTTGCNIPLFVAGRNKIQSIYTNRNGYSFEWHNFYDEDDVLGWPLKPLGKFFDQDKDGASYYDSITRDHEINANSTFQSTITKSWNPLSHGEYWRG